MYLQKCIYLLYLSILPYLWQKEASDKSAISCKRAKCVCHLHWRQWNIMMSYLTYLLVGWVFLHESWLKKSSLCEYENINNSNLDGMSLASFCQVGQYLSIYLSTYIVSIFYLSMYISMYIISIYLSIYLSIYILSMCMYLSISMYYVSFYMYLSTHSFIHSFIYSFMTSAYPESLSSALSGTGDRTPTGPSRSGCLPRTSMKPLEI